MKARLSLPRRRGRSRTLSRSACPSNAPNTYRVPWRRLSIARWRSGRLRSAQPAPAVGRRLTGHIWSKLDHDAVLGRRGVEREHPSGLGLVVGIGAGLPRPCALKRQTRPGEDAPQLRRRDLDDPLFAQIAREALERPACGRTPARVGTGTGHRDDPSALLV